MQLINVFFRSTVSKVIEEYGKIDYLVNNGGGQFPSYTHDMSLKGWNAVIGESYESFDRKRALVKNQSQSEVIKVMLQFHT